MLKQSKPYKGEKEKKGKLIHYREALTNIELIIPSHKVQPVAQLDRKYERGTARNTLIF